jgi:protein-disulfide isomerase
LLIFSRWRRFVNRRRILAGILSLGLLGVLALLLPSLHQTSETPSTAPQRSTPPPAQPVDSSTNSEPAAIPTPALVADAAPRPRSPQTAPGLPDVDPHKAFGSKSAPIALEVFSDFQCPACKNLFVTTNRRLRDVYVSTGKVYLIERDFPLPIHAYSRVAARYGRAAAQINKFEEVEQVLFLNQEKWEQTGEVDGTVATVLSPADMNKVRALVKGGTLEAAIEKDIALGHVYNVYQTPTSVFHYKGQTYPYAGGMTFEIMKQFIDQLLAQK